MTIKIWQIQNRKLIKTLHGHTEPIKTISLSSDNSYLASGGWDKIIRIWVFSSYELMKQIPFDEDGEGEEINYIVYEINNSFLAACAGDIIKIFETYDYSTLYRIESQ